MNDSRRRFLHQSALLLASSSAPITWSRAAAPGRKFRLCLNAGAIGVQLNQKELLDAAINFGFEAIVALPDELLAMSDDDLGALKEKMEENGITWGSAVLPLDFRGTEARYREGLKGFPQRCAALQKAGVSRMNTWIMPTNDSLTYLSNFKLHTIRLAEVAGIAGHYGLPLGLEYVGPKTLMARDKYAFIRTLSETRELIFAIDRPNVGLVLDSYHWYCAGETVADLMSVSKEEVITVDLNDARAGRSRDEQIDQERELPLGSGLIDIKGFLQSLVDIGYDGPVRAEPFNKTLNEMSDNDALRTTATAMKKSFELVGG